MKSPFQADNDLPDRIEGISSNPPRVVLLMDDEESILDSFGNLLRMKGYTVHTASDGEEAVEIYKRALLSEQKVDVAIIDLSIPYGMGGIETVARIKEIDPRVQAIATTGHFQDSLTDGYKKYGFAGILPKPYILKELLEIINRTIGMNQD